MADDFIPYAEEPPAKKKKESKYSSRLDRLKGFPPGWYVIGVFENTRSAKTQASQYKTALKKRFPDFDFKAGSTDTGSKLYAFFKHPEEAPKKKKKAIKKVKM